MLNNNFSLKNKGVSNFKLTVNEPRHRWYYYKEGFSSDLVQKAIEDSDIAENDLVIDPFNGSGTVTLTSALIVFNSIGYEVNPFTSFLSKAKLGTISDKKFLTVKASVLNACESLTYTSLQEYSTFSDNGKNRDWLFNPEVLQSFESGWLNTFKYNGDTRNIMQLALIASAMDNCNARKDGKCLKYKNNWQELNLNQETYINSLSKRLDEIQSDLQISHIIKRAKVECGDSRKIIEKNLKEKFKLCITSPPYLNTFDYSDIYRPELFLGKFLNKHTDLYDLRLTTVRSHVQARWDLPTENDFGTLYKTALIGIIQKKDILMHKEIPNMIQAYFEDMKNLLCVLKSKAQPDASLWMVVSTSAYADIEIPVDLILAEIGIKQGWYLREIGVLRYVKKRKTKHSPNINELRESVIIFDNQIRRKI